MLAVLQEPMVETLLEEIKRRALVIAAEIEAKCGPRRAEIVPGATPQWHVVTTEPAGEGRALQHLSQRGFAAYLPSFDQRMGWIARGPIFPRHLFLFVWDVLHHWRRVRECPGVTSILVRDERPVVMQDRDMARIQMIEIGGLAALQRSGKRPRRRRHPGEAAPLDPLDIVISCKSHWDNLATLDGEARIGVLHKALGLSPRSGSSLGS